MTSPWGGAGSLDGKMIADLREWRSRITPAPSEAERSAGHPYSVQLRLEEVDALLAAIDERDALKREACEMPDERPANVTPIRTVHYSGAARVVPVDLATLVDAAVEEDERVIAWDAIAAHPFFRECYGTKASLLEAMLAKLTASTFTADIPDEIRKRIEDEGADVDSPIGRAIRREAERPRPVNCRCSVAPILHDHPAEDEVSIEIRAEMPREFSTLPCGHVFADVPPNHCRYCGRPIIPVAGGASWRHVVGLAAYHPATRCDGLA